LPKKSSQLCAAGFEGDAGIDCFADTPLTLSLSPRHAFFGGEAR